MKKLKTLIVENELSPLKKLLGLLQAYPNVIDLDCLQIAKSFTEAQNIILNGNTFDLSILDKNLGGGRTCFNLITKENKEAFGIIALNSQDKTSQKHFEEISPLSDYMVLGKPYNKDDVAELIEKVRFIKQRRDAIEETNPPVLLKEKNREFPVSQDRISYIEVNDNYCYIFYVEGEGLKKFPVTKQLIHYEAILNKKIFIRISDKHLLNMNFVEEIREGKIKLKVKYKNEDITLPLSDKNKAVFHSRYTK